MKKIILIAIIFLVPSSVIAMTSDAILNYTIECDIDSNTSTRQERFKNFVNGEISKICKFEQLASVIKSINETLTRYNISLKIKEQRSGNLACFVHNVEKMEFDKDGLLKQEALDKIRANGLSINVNCKYSRDTGSFVVFDERGNQELWCETPYCGNVMTSTSGDVELREIGITLCPFYVVLFHELLHLKHFLDTVEFQISNKSDQKFIPYGKALSIENRETYKKLLTPEQQEAFGDIAEFDDDIFVENLKSDLETLVKNNSINPSWTPKVIKATLVEKLKTRLIVDEKNEILFCGNKVDLSIIERLAAHPDWENLEEIRTVFGSKQDLITEGSIRDAIRLPPRGIYGIPQSRRYILNSTVEKRYHQNISREYIIGMSSEKITEAEAEYVPLCVRLLTCKDRVILNLAEMRVSQTYLETIKLVRYALGIEFDQNMEVMTPAKILSENASKVDKQEGRITPVPSSSSESDAD